MFCNQQTLEFYFLQNLFHLKISRCKKDFVTWKKIHRYKLINYDKLFIN